MWTVPNLLYTHPLIFRWIEWKFLEIQLLTTERSFFENREKTKKIRKKKINSFEKFFKCALERHLILLYFNSNPRSLVPVDPEISMSKVENFDLDLCQGHSKYKKIRKGTPRFWAQHVTQQVWWKNTQKRLRYQPGNTHRHTHTHTHRQTNRNLCISVLHTEYKNNNMFGATCINGASLAYSPQC